MEVEDYINKIILMKFMFNCKIYIDFIKKIHY